MKEASRGATWIRAAAVIGTAALVLGVIFLGHFVIVGPSSGSSSTVETITAPGVPCTDPSLPSSVVSVEGDPKFTQLSDGLCYNSVGQGETASGTSGTSTVYTFDYYNGSVFYPCGDFPKELVVSEITAEVVANGSQSAVRSAELNNDTSSLNASEGCGPSRPTVGVVKAQLVEVTIPAVLEVNLTLQARSAAVPVTSLSAVVEFPSGNQTIAFSAVTIQTPLSPGGYVSQISIISGPPGFASGGIYKMVIEGQLQGGQTFQYAVTIAMVTN